MSIITPKYLYGKFTSILGGEDLGADVVYDLMEEAKNQIEDELKLAILKSVDTSQTANVGDTYLTMKSLPTDWRQTLKIVVGNILFAPVKYTSREAYRNAARRYYLDYKNQKYALCGSIGSSQPINHYYMVTTPIISSSNEDDPTAIVWPDRFKNLLPYKMALVHQTTSQGDVTSYRLGPGASAAYEDLLDAFIAWDHDLKLQDMNGRTGYADDVDDMDESDWRGRIGLM